MGRDKRSFCCCKKLVHTLAMQSSGFLDVNFLSNTCNMVNKLKFLFLINTWLSIVHTWAMFSLWHLANMSCMVPFWASTDSSSVPIWGPRPKPRRPEEVVYILNDSCSHFTQHLFPPRVLSTHMTTSYCAHNIKNIIHTYYTSLHMYIHIFIYKSRTQLYFFRSSWQAGCSRILVSVTSTCCSWIFHDICILLVKKILKIVVLPKWLKIGKLSCVLLFLVSLWKIPLMYNSEWTLP
jgi:hypothetical protein